MDTNTSENYLWYLLPCKVEHVHTLPTNSTPGHAS